MQLNLAWPLTTKFILIWTLAYGARAAPAAEILKHHGHNDGDHTVARLGVSERAAARTNQQYQPH